MSNVIVGSSFNNKKEEKVAAETITPGYLIELNSDDKFQKHASPGGTAIPCFADIDKWQGKGLDDDYESDDLVAGWYPGPGDIVENAVLDKDSPDVDVGDFLESNGDGKLRKHDVASSADVISKDRQIVGLAIEEVVPDGADTRFKFQVV
jgi:hypothetical protein